MWLLDENLSWPLIISCEEVAERKCKRAGGEAAFLLALASEGRAAARLYLLGI